MGGGVGWAFAFLPLVECLFFSLLWVVGVSIAVNQRSDEQTTTTTTNNANKEKHHTDGRRVCVAYEASASLHKSIEVNLNRRCTVCGWLDTGSKK